MKKIASILVAAVWLSLNSASFAQSAGSSFPPLPDHFDGMKEMKSDFKPIAIYRVRGTSVLYACMGVAIRTGTDTISAIIPEHLFIEERSSEEVYGVRIARPDSKGLIGFINKITFVKKEGSRDIVIAEIGTNRVPVKSFSEIKLTSAVLFSGSPTVTLKEKETKKIRSHITGEEVKILGYGVTPSEEFLNANMDPKNKGVKMTIVDTHPYVAIETTSKPGSSGHPYFDEHGRLYILHGGADPDGTSTAATQKQMNIYSQKMYGKPIKGFAYLTGPIELFGE